MWARAEIPWIPVISETTGLVAVLFAPGLAAEPALRRKRWTLVERFGFSATVSSVLTILTGVGLHLVGSPITTSNVLAVLLAVSVVTGIASLGYRRRPHRLPCPRTGRIDVVAGLASLVLLGSAIATVLVVRLAPDRSYLEAAMIDDAGQLLALPLHARLNSEAYVNVTVRSASGLTSSTSLVVHGDGVRTWSASIVPNGDWAVIRVPIAALRSGTVHAVIEIRGDRASLSLPIQIEVGR